MAEFTPIETQEAFDSAIKDRLARQEKTIRSEYSDYEELKAQSMTWAEEKRSYEEAIAAKAAEFDALNEKYAEATGQIEAYKSDAMKTKIAIESGIPMELKDHLKGNSEEEIKASAAALGKFAKGNKPAPLADPEGDPPKDNKEKAMRDMLKSLKGDN